MDSYKMDIFDSNFTNVTLNSESLLKAQISDKLFV
jgi:hypothetical protein